MKKFFVLGVSLLFLTAAMADTYTWQGGVDSKFITPANWQVNGNTAERSPGESDKAEIKSKVSVEIEDGDNVTVNEMLLRSSNYNYGENAGSLIVKQGGYLTIPTVNNVWSIIGHFSGGVLDVKGGTVNIGNVKVGHQYGQGDVVVEDAGKLNCNGALYIGTWTQGSEWGRLTVKDGTVSFGVNQLIVGQDAEGTVNQTGGTVEWSEANDTPNTVNPSIGNNANRTGVWNLSGGKVVRPRQKDGGTSFGIGNRGNGAMNISGSGELYVNDWLKLGINSGSSGVLTLDGGLTAVRTFKGGNGTSSVVFNGGVLSPTVANATWFQTVGSLLIKEGGAVISNDFDVTIDHVLATGATHDGGLVKKGASTLTLSAANTFNGPVVIEMGTLKLGCDNALPAGVSVTVKSGATLDLNGKTFAGTIIDESAGTAKAYGTAKMPGAEVLGERLLKNAVGWYDASDAQALTKDGETDHVTVWANKAAGGGAYDLAKSGDGAAFLADGSSKYGKDAVAFTNSWSLVSKSSLAWSENQPRTIVSVGYMDTAAYDEANPGRQSWDRTHFFPLCISSGDQAGSFGFAHWIGDNSGYWDTAGKQDGDGNPVGNFVEVSDSFAMPDDAWAVQCMWSDGAKVGGFKTAADGATTALPETSLAGTLGTPSNAKIMIGQYMQYGWRGYGAVAEAAVFDRALSSAELSELNGYLSRKWFGQAGIPYGATISDLELIDGSSLDIADTVATIGTLSGMGAVDGSNAMLTVDEFAPVCGDITVNAPVAEPAEGEYVTLRITVNPANGDCGTLVVPAGYDLSKVDLVVTGCAHLTSANTFAVFQGKAGEALSRFHSVSSDSDCGLSLKYDSASGNVSGSLKKGMMIIIR